jgi:hypothetical protein
VDPLKEAGREAILELLEALLGEQGAAGGVEGDEGAVEEGVGEGAWVEEDDPWRVLTGRRWSSPGGAWRGPRRWRARSRALAEADGVDGL